MIHKFQMIFNYLPPRMSRFGRGRERTEHTLRANSIAWETRDPAGHFAAPELQTRLQSNFIEKWSVYGGEIYASKNNYSNPNSFRRTSKNFASWLQETGHKSDFLQLLQLRDIKRLRTNPDQRMAKLLSFLTPLVQSRKTGRTRREE